MHFHLFFLHRLIKEMTYREFTRYHNKTITPPIITNKEYLYGQSVKCPMKCTKGALRALHKALEDYMVGLMQDTNFVGHSCKGSHSAAPGHPACMQNMGREDLDGHGCRVMRQGMVFRYTWVYSKEGTMAHTRRLVVTS